MIAINQALKALHEWPLENKIESNIDKTMYQSSTLKYQSSEIDSKYNGSSVIETAEALYLGVKFDKKFPWQRHIEAHSF